MTGTPRAPSGRARIAVVGGGLAGLTVAFRRLAAGDDVTLLEASPRVGGQLWTERDAGFVVEHGAEGFVAGSEAVPQLAADLGVGSDLVGQETLRSYGFDGSGLRELGPGEAASFLGFQVARDALGKGIRTFRRGMGELTEALARSIDGRVDVRVGERVLAVSHDAEGFALDLANDTLRADAVVIATEARVAGRLLAAWAGAAAEALNDAETLSSLTVTVAFDRRAVDHPLDGTGFVVAQAAQEHGFRACTFITSKFAERAPLGMVTLRAFFRPSPVDLASLSDDAWVARATASLGGALPLSGAPSRAWVSRWTDALPVFTPTHRAKVTALEARLPPKLVLAGSAFHGSGIDACVRSAEAAAARVG